MKICPVGTEFLLADGRTNMAKRTRLERTQFNDQNDNTFIWLASHKLTTKKAPAYFVIKVAQNLLPLKECVTKCFYVEYLGNCVSDFGLVCSDDG
jgi:hypothetical protein